MNDRDRRREKRRRRAGKDYRTLDLGNGIELADPETVLRAMGALPPDLDWATLAPNVIPILPRWRPMPPGVGEPLRVTLPPGIPTGFGVDIGPASLVVGAGMLAGWRLEPGELVATGLENLRTRMRSVRRRDIVPQTVDGVPMRLLLSGVGCASALVLIPDELERIFGRDPQCLVAPMRDLLISMPVDTDRAFVGWLRDECSLMDPNGLDLDAFVFEDGRLRYESLRPGRAVA